MKNTKITDTDITLGERLKRSVFNNKGELLLRSGKVVTTERQLEVLLNHGYFMNKQTKSTRSDRPSEISKTADSASEESIFDIKERWIAELYSLLIGSQKTAVSNFSHRVLTLALEIQLQAQNQHDGLIAALQLDEQNHYGLVHALHCAVNCEMIGLANGLGQIGRLAVVAAALTHDIGLIIEQAYFNEIKGKLSPEQQAAIQQHPIKSERILRHLGIRDKLWLDTVRHHHERLDGSGYPDKISGTKISVYARILAIADVYSAIVHPTAFRRQNSGKYALTTLYQAREKQLDGQLIERFISELGVYPPGSLVRLKNHEVGVVITQGDLKHQPMVASLIGGAGEVYRVGKQRDSSQESYHIVKEEPLEKFNILRFKIEKLFY